ncbi:DedA family protein [Nocardioides sp. CER19]|uniref:DedA family protein n=1 Tax=Nocardioides sp. CER19 TaxID=3038538 RepID=UPI0024488F1A|nr:DedA family protein [Nocardioides sp. CER19]MDH2415292.1 DedA family protein [Nocardioides sp. CER19]
MSGFVDHLLSTPAWLTLLIVFALPALESSAFLGIIFPGETAVLLGGVAASQGHVPLLGVVAAAVGGAITGDAVGYVVGRRWGRRILGSTLGRFVKAEHLDRAEHVLDRRGGLAVLLGRFTAALRVLIPGLAGMGRMSYPRFAFFNILGAAIWGVLVVAAGDLAGNNWHVVGHLITGIGGVATAVVIAALVAVRLLRGGRLRRAAQGLAARMRSIVPALRRWRSATTKPASSTCGS